MQELEEIANWLNDGDLQWWPFLFMRPAQHERMSSLRVLAIAILYGVPTGILANIWLSLVSGGARVPALAVPLVLTAALFVAFRLTLARAWNRRARRLAARRDVNAA